ncbi:uncharacterized protein LOC120254852 [Dioscorea cayenensis subsp. rotundata]|uniref:Uncharacterized protein LOC120254852 n=1 Tax=Dioscorea cayennensis subsp. rotundata TaxID=55577 RepID=A0AB40AUJ4_DIOCR|nr:uncharacterized protein LOC120254852 [Dioscorea cayenensis subsp. rotundata]
MVAVEVEVEAEGFTEKEAVDEDGTQTNLCRYKNKEANLAEDTKDTKEADKGLLFMASSEDTNERGDMWLIDSGCSNHMSGNRMIFQNLEEVSNQTIRLGDGNILQVGRISSIVLRSDCGRTNTLTDVQYVPHLAHNLLSDWSVMSSGYLLSSLEEKCVIKDARLKPRLQYA